MIDKIIEDFYYWLFLLIINFSHIKYYRNHKHSNRKGMGICRYCNHCWDSHDTECPLEYTFINGKDWYKG